MPNSAIPPIEAEIPNAASPVLDEATFLLSWDSDIRLAARNAAVIVADEEDLVQAIRMRLLVVHRRFPDVPRAYLRVVIVNMLRSIRRHLAQRFTAGSPLAQPITEELGALVKDPIDTVCDVSIWTSRLPRRLRDVYRHIYEEGRSQRDAAKVMRITQPRVAQLHRQLLEKASRDLANMAA